MQAIKPVCLAVGLSPAGAAVNIPFVAKFIEDDVFTPNDNLIKSADDLLDELVALQGALASLR